MKADLHLHSEFSWDSKTGIEEYIEKAEKRNFGAISITDHNSIESHSLIDNYQNNTDLILVPGQEISTKDGHLLIYGWVDLLPSNLSMKETVKTAKKTDNCICIAAHPYDPFRKGSFSKVFSSGIDGIEILNASCWFGLFNWMAKRGLQSKEGFFGLANSDAHRIEEFGTAWNNIDGNVTNLSELFSVLNTAIPAGGRIGILRKFNRFLRRKFN